MNTYYCTNNNNINNNNNSRNTINNMKKKKKKKLNEKYISIFERWKLLWYKLLNTKLNLFTYSIMFKIIQPKKVLHITHYFFKYKYST
jgi:hypothetical protein